MPVHKLISRNEKTRDWNYCRTKMQLKTTQQQRHLLKQKDIQYENEKCRNWTPSTNKSEKYIQYEIEVSDMFYLFEKGGRLLKYGMDQNKIKEIWLNFRCSLVALVALYLICPAPPAAGTCLLEWRNVSDRDTLFIMCAW